ncbi:hypothetical protein BDV38DRAFT_254118 [Aspergillus pseudotamarii]|uniref:Uncharacterized protein n=1 Tax=Aspergillus pseudotamarii TaxID=132259 RepID=A0A5N6SLF7_ASPPS|nr:uncharacterized protein BDV38DRAFT_254118 [Aspergillus pseudotamarii]KAE8134739.1 hypothetical protein BDV38DRAFT_254118 [Aspergillus pseudotamarii]
MLLLQTGLIPESEISSSPVKDAGGTPCHLTYLIFGPYISYKESVEVSKLTRFKVDTVCHARKLCGISMSNRSQ